MIEEEKKGDMPSQEEIDASLKKLKDQKEEIKQKFHPNEDYQPKEVQLKEQLALWKILKPEW